MHLSAVARGFIAGLLRHAREITLVTNQWVNSYKRLIPGFEAPVRVAWSRRNALQPATMPQARAADRMPGDLLRVPEYRTGARSRRASSTARRTPPATRTWPSRRCSPPASRASRASTRCRPAATRPTRRASRSAETLPGSLYEALAEAEKSELLRRCLGRPRLREPAHVEAIEWERYRSHITDYELREYLPIL